MRKELNYTKYRVETLFYSMKPYLVPETQLSIQVA